MPISPTFPGVYIDELLSAVRTITGVPTSIAAFVGTAPRGAVDRPVHITSWADYEREFGGLDKSSAMSYAVHPACGDRQGRWVRMLTVADQLTYPPTYQDGGTATNQTASA